MEEHFVLRVPPALAERLNKVLCEDPSAGSDAEIDLAFEGDGRTGHFTMGGQTYPAALLDLPCVVESWKTYDYNSLVKAADIGQMVLVREPGEAAPEAHEQRHGLTPPMRDARRRRFRRDPDVNPSLVEAVERDLQSIMAGGTAKDQEEEAEDDEHTHVAAAAAEDQDAGDGKKQKKKKGEGRKSPGGAPK
eukprot:jgi/Mesen1/8162/ME000438S07265